MHVAARGAPYDVKRVALWWNAGLSAFSCVGLASCAPVLLGAPAANDYIKKIFNEERKSSYLYL